MGHLPSKTFTRHIYHIIISFFSSLLSGRISSLRDDTGAVSNIIHSKLFTCNYMVTCDQAFCFGSTQKYSNARVGGSAKGGKKNA